MPLPRFMCHSYPGVYEDEGPPPAQQGAGTVDKAELQRQRGYSDGRAGHSPASLTKAYVEGYEKGRNDGRE